MPTSKRRGSRLKRWLIRISLAILILGAIVGFAAPYVVGSGWVKGQISKQIRSNLDGDVTIDSIDFSWGRGVTLTGLRVGNPDGFPSGDALRVERIYAGWSWRSLLSFDVNAKLSVDKPEVFVHVRKDGAINFVELQKAKSADGGADDDADEQREPKGKSSKKSSGRLDLQLRMEVRDGLVEVIDEQRKLAQRVENIRVEVANDAINAPIRFAMSSDLAQKGSAPTGKLSADGMVDPTREQPLEFFSCETSGLQLEDYAPVVSAMMPASGFESFRGAVRGKLAAKPVENSESFAFTGDLVVRKLDVRGGPFGPSRGLVADEWTVRPNVRVNLSDRSAILEGTQIDLGFAKIRALSTTDAKALLASKNDAAAITRALGLIVDVDLAALGAQPIMPKGQYAGTLQMRISAVPPSSDQKTLPWGASVRATGVRVAGDFLSQAITLDQPFEIRSVGRSDFGDDAVASAGDFEVSGAGLEGGGDFRVAKDYDAKLAIDLVAGEVSKLIAGFLPKGLALAGEGRVEMKIAGALPGESREGGLLAAELPRVEAKLRAPKLSWLGSTLEGFEQVIKLADGKLDVTTPGGAKLNAGPLTLDLAMKDLLGDEQRVDFKIKWTGGRANGGMTPALQYVLPLLAGLPTKDLASIAGISFDATTGLELAGGGPVPTKTADFLKALESWNANGRLLLENGSFSPSPALSSVFRFFQNQSKISFRNIRSKIRVKDGKIWTDGLEMGGSDGIVRLTGSTTLAGTLDVKLDISDVLSKHSDGKKVLKILGGEISTALGGTLWQPKLDLGATFDKALKSALENTVQDAAKNALDGLLKGKKPDLKGILRGLGGKK